MATTTPKLKVKKEAKTKTAVAKKAKARTPEVVSSTKETGSLRMTVLDSTGKSTGTVTLPKELFGASINAPLVAQAIRVHLANTRMGQAAVKTRGMVEGSTRKIYRQKGTGKARHGSIRAPIFVGGGVVFGPQPRDYHLLLPKSMKRGALVSALTSQYKNGNVIVANGLGSVGTKTKHMAEAISNLVGTSAVLLVIAKDNQIVMRLARNIPTVDIVPVANLTTYDVMIHPKILFMKEALGSLV